MYYLGINIFDIIKCKRIKKQISSLYLTGICYEYSMKYESIKEEIRKLIRSAKHFEHLQKISFQGFSVSYFYNELYYANTFIKAVFQLVKTCRNLKQVEFIDRYNGFTTEEIYKRQMKKLFGHLTQINKITLKYCHNDKVFEYTRW